MVLFQFEAVRLTPAFLSLACVRVEVLTQTRQEISMVEMNSVCQLVLDWIHRQIKEEGSSVSDMAEKVCTQVKVLVEMNIFSELQSNKKLICSHICCTWPWTIPSKIVLNCPVVK